jgi:hypothetical protein
MKKLSFIFILLISIYSCKNDNRELTNNVKQSEFAKKAESINLKNDTLVVSDVNTLVFIDPNEKDIEQLKKKHGEENFYIIADDVSCYLANIR